MTSSILTNNSAMNAVSSLSATQSQLAMTQSQISTGLKVNSAQDNASYWSIATSMRSDVGALSSVSDSLNLGISVVSTALQAVSSSIGVLSQMKDLVVSAQTAGQDTTTIDAQMVQLQQQLRSYANSATFNGVNLLATGSTAAESVVTSFSQGTTGVDTVGFTTISLTTALYSTANGSQGTAGTGILDVVVSSATSGYSTADESGMSIDNMTTSGASSTTLTAEQNQLETAINLLTGVASTLGSQNANLTAQGTFTQSLSNSLTSGVGSLVDADMNQASTRLNALQTQQQLGIQSLSIANSNSQMILKLFGI